jgi:hypothetical protein
VLIPHRESATRSWRVKGGSYVEVPIREIQNTFCVGAQSRSVVVWNRGSRLVLSHAGRVPSKDIWICSKGSSRSSKNHFNSRILKIDP